MADPGFKLGNMTPEGMYLILYPMLKGAKSEEGAEAHNLKSII